MPSMRMIVRTAIVAAVLGCGHKVKNTPSLGDPDATCTIDATNPSWQSCNLSVHKGDSLRMAASGQWSNYAAGGLFTGPAGEWNANGRVGSSQHAWAALMVGTDTGMETIYEAAFDTQYDTTEISYTVGVDGDVVLRMNDDSPTDNAGSMDVKIWVE